jgi:O-antigen ligase
LDLTAARKFIADLFATAAQFCFACVLFLSPLAYRTTYQERRIGNVYSSYTDFFYYPHDYFLGACLLLGFLALLVRWQRPVRGPWYMTFPLLLIILLSWFGVLTGIDSSLTAYHSLRLTGCFGLYLFLVNFSPAPLWTVIPLALGVMREALIAIQQFRTQLSVGLQQWGELLLDPQLDGTSIVRDGAFRFLRAYGLTDHPNLLGGFFAFALILILGYYFAAAHTRARYFLLVPLALGNAALVLTFSRAAWLATVAGIVFLTICLLWNKTFRAGRLRPALLVGAVLLVAALVPILNSPNLIAQRSGQTGSLSTNSGEIRSLNERDALLESATRIFYKHAVTGVGNGALPLAMYQLDSEFDTTYYYQPVHIVLLEIATELGLFGAASWLFVMLVPWLVLFARRLELASNAWLAGIAAAFLILTLIGLFDYYPWLLPHGRIWQWTVLGLLAAALSRPHTIPTN